MTYVSSFPRTRARQRRRAIVDLAGRIAWTLVALVAAGIGAAVLMATGLEFAAQAEPGDAGYSFRCIAYSLIAMGGYWALFMGYVSVLIAKRGHA